jgi:hypothetical protein
VPPKSDNHITLHIKTTAGEDDERFNQNNKVRVLLDRAIKRFELDENPPSPYRVIRESNGATLDLDARLEDYELKDGETIIVRATRPTDG